MRGQSASAGELVLPDEGGGLVAEPHRSESAFVSSGEPSFVLRVAADAPRSYVARDVLVMEEFSVACRTFVSEEDCLVNYFDRVHGLLSDPSPLRVAKNLSALQWWVVLYESIHRANVELYRRRRICIHFRGVSIVHASSTACRLLVRSLDMYVEGPDDVVYPVHVADILVRTCGSRSKQMREVLSMLVCSHRSHELIESGLAKITGACEYDDEALIRECIEERISTEHARASVHARAPYLCAEDASCVAELICRELHLHQPLHAYTYKTSTCPWYDPARGILFSNVPQSGCAASLVLEGNAMRAMRQMIAYIDMGKGPDPALRETRWVDAQTAVVRNPLDLLPEGGSAPPRTLVVCSPSVIDSWSIACAELCPSLVVQEMRHNFTRVKAGASVVVTTPTVVRKEFMRACYGIDGNNVRLLLGDDVVEEECAGEGDDDTWRIMKVSSPMHDACWILRVQRENMTIHVDVCDDRSIRVGCRMPEPTHMAGMRVWKRYACTARGRRKLEQTYAHGGSMYQQRWQRLIVHESACSSSGDSYVARALSHIRRRYAVGMISSGRACAASFLMQACHVDGTIDASSCKNASHELHLKRAYLKYLCVTADVAEKRLSRSFDMVTVNETLEKGCRDEYLAIEEQLIRTMCTSTKQVPLVEDEATGVLLAADAAAASSWDTPALRRFLEETRASGASRAEVGDMLRDTYSSAQLALMLSVFDGREDGREASRRDWMDAFEASEKDMRTFAAQYNKCRQVFYGLMDRVRFARKPGQHAVQKTEWKDTLRVKEPSDVACAICLEEGEQVHHPMLINPGGCEHVCCASCLESARRRSHRCPVCRSTIASTSYLVSSDAAAESSKRARADAASSAICRAIEMLRERNMNQILCISSGSHDMRRAEEHARSCAGAHVANAGTCKALHDVASQRADASQVIVCAANVASQYSGSCQFDAILLTRPILQCNAWVVSLLRAGGILCVCYFEDTVDDVLIEEMRASFAEGGKPRLVRMGARLRHARATARPE